MCEPLRQSRFHSGTVLRDSELMTSIITKIGTLSDSVIPAAAKARLLALLEPGGFIAKMATTKMCFVAGTPVHTPGGLVPIEEIRPGDMVLSRDPKTGEQGFKAVLQTFVTHPDMLYRVEYAAGAADAAEGSSSPKTGTLVGTGQHPFYVESVAAFVPASELRIGDRLRLADGSAAYVTDVRVERGPPASVFDGDSTLTTYNFEVADWHTYFVGHEGVWVHNVGDICQRAFSIFQRHVDDLGESPETAFKFVEKILTKHMTDSGMTESEQIRHMGDVLDSVVKEARNLDESTILWTSTKKETSAQNMWSHWVKHQEEWADMPEVATAANYVERALDFTELPPGNGVRVGLSKRPAAAGQIIDVRVVIRPSTREFAMREATADGTLRKLKTLFRADYNELAAKFEEVALMDPADVDSWLGFYFENEIYAELP